MKKFLLFLACSSMFSIFAVENNPLNPAEKAIQHYPREWAIAKLGGGLAGIGYGLTSFFFMASLKDALDDAEGRIALKHFKPIRVLAAASVAYASWKGGQALAEAAWHTAWNGREKAKKWYNIMSNKEQL